MTTQVTRAAGPTSGGPVVPARGTWRPLDVTAVSVSRGFWGALQATNARATLEHCETWMEREGWLANFDRVADGGTAAGRDGWEFSDSEVYKLLEALSWELGRTSDPRLDEVIARLTARVARAMDADGYLNTCFGHAGQPPRYSDLEFGHELYCTGHLLQAAVARFRTVGEDALVALARRAADHVCETFAPGALELVCGHPEIEVGLAELGRALQEQRYIDQAAAFVERRGTGVLKSIPLGQAYFQDDVPVREATVWRGHAVRALYLAAAAVDVAIETDDSALFAAVERQWETTVARRTYVTGGMGSRHQDEGFGEDWELPPDRAYCETCAGVASVMVSWRLFLATGEAKYADLMERTFFNVIATSPRSDGRAFFYANPLQQRVAGPVSDDSVVSPRAEGGTRAAWFDVSCCPTNVARTLAAWQTYAAAVGERELVVLQYAGGRIRATLGTGAPVHIEVETSYPDDGLVAVRVLETGTEPWGLRLRVPSWAHGARLEDGATSRVVEPGFVVVDRRFAVGDVIRLHLPLATRTTRADERIDAVRGCVAFERGPLVLCAESVDLPDGAELDRWSVDTSVPPTERRGQTWVRIVRGPDDPDEAWPYDVPSRPADGEVSSEAAFESAEMRLVPYHSWAERGPSAMRVWLPEAR